MKITCCILEDERTCQENLRELIETWAKENHCVVQIDIAASENVFWKLRVREYDVFFLDIMLGKSAAGVGVARTLREKQINGGIIFLTSFREYVFEGYPVSAIDYLLKPASYDRITHCMNRVHGMIKDRTFVFRGKNGIVQMPYDQILYFSSQNHSTQMVTINGSYLLPYSFKDVRSKLPAQFSQCHRTVIVNMELITFLGNTELRLCNGEVLPIGRTHLQELRHDLMSLVRCNEKRGNITS
jgi:DNA-binding LytR/AlgR family response regulator